MQQKRRLCLYLDPKLGARLEKLAAKPGATMTNIVSDALRDLLDRQGNDALDERIKERMDKSSGQLGRIERDQRVILESLALFIRYQLTISNPVPDSQLAAMQALGNERFQTFIDEVGRRLAKGMGLGAEITEKAKGSS
ncbi:MAG TPA: CopG family transcriptional regulator [Devosia sp.]|nr:CopG family transcriptional regulator [Devosia sp.]